MKLTTICACCGKEITAENRYKLLNGFVTHVTHADSQAGEPQTGDGCLRPADKEQVDGK
jgi:hypothetical protein